MTVLPEVQTVSQTTAVLAAENLRRLGIPEIDGALDAYKDRFSICNSRLTERERICRLANQLASVKDLASEVMAEITAVVKRLRRAFNLQHHMEGVVTYGVVTKLIYELVFKYPQYNIDTHLRLYTRFVTVRTATAIKAETARMIAELLVIGMNADAEGFRDDLEQTVGKATKVMLTWM